MVAGAARARLRRPRAPRADLAQRAACRCGAGSRERWPDLIKSNGGGCQRDPDPRRAIAGDDHRFAVLRTRPERRVVHGVRLGGTWVCNLHAQVWSEEQAQHGRRGRRRARVLDLGGRRAR